MESDGITLPTARVTLEYGLTESGESVMSECWENLADPDELVPMITKAGMLTMAQQTLTYLVVRGEDDE
jgi:hypothetical protein